MAQKKYPTSKQFSAELKKGLKHSIHLFLGEAEGDKDKVIGQILGQLFTNEEDRRNNSARFFITEDRSSGEELLAAADFAMSGSMFSTTRACIIRNFENVKPVEANRAVVKDMITGLAGGTLLIITSSQNQPPPLLDKFPEETIHAVQFWKQFDSDLVSYIRKAIADKGVKLEDRLVTLMIELTGSDIRKIDELIDMLEYSAKDTQVNEGIIRDLAGDAREMNVFEFTDLLFRKERRALPCLKRLIEEGTAELMILGMIMRQAESIEKYYGYLDMKLSRDEALAKLGLAASKLRREKFIEAINRISRGNLKKIFPLIARAEYMLKSGGAGTTLAGNPVFILAAEIISMK